MHQRGATPINPLDGAVSCPMPAPPGRSVPQGRGGWGGVGGEAHGNPLPTMGTKSIPCAPLHHHHHPLNINGLPFIYIYMQVTQAHCTTSSHITALHQSYLNWGEGGSFRTKIWLFVFIANNSLLLKFKGARPPGKNTSVLHSQFYLCESMFKILVSKMIHYAEWYLSLLHDALTYNQQSLTQLRTLWAHRYTSNYSWLWSITG